MVVKICFLLWEFRPKCAVMVHFMHFYCANPPLTPYFGALNLTKLKLFDFKEFTIDYF